MVKDTLDLENLEGVGPATKHKLMNAGVRSILDIVIRSPQEIAGAVGVDMSRAYKLYNKARLKLVEMGKLEGGFVPAIEYYKKRMAIERITTGSESFDKLLGGGVETQSITEVYGEYGSGKTQLCMTLCVTVQLPKDEGGLESKAIYIDTEGTFRPERVAEIAETRGLDTKEVLTNVTYAKAYNSAHQELLVSEVGSLMERDGYKLLVVDSAVAHYRAEFLGRGTLADRQQRLNRFVHMLLRIGEVYNIAVVVTNQVQASPDVFFGDPSRPTGGNVVAHTSTYRIYLRKAGKNRIARMVDSPYHPEIESPFTITKRGVDDLAGK